MFEYHRLSIKTLQNVPFRLLFIWGDFNVTLGPMSHDYDLDVENAKCLPKTQDNNQKMF